MEKYFQYFLSNVIIVRDTNLRELGSIINCCVIKWLNVRTIANITKLYTFVTVIIKVIKYAYIISNASIFADYGYD